MDFLRAVSIILVVMNVYWFCYEAIRLWGVDIGVVDRILMNFNRTAGLFRSILYTKLFAVLLLALSCLGTKGVCMSQYFNTLASEFLERYPYYADERHIFDFSLVFLG